MDIVIKNNICVEICLTSNLMRVVFNNFARKLPKFLSMQVQNGNRIGVPSHSSIPQGKSSDRYLCMSSFLIIWPKAIIEYVTQTDDILPFRTSLLAEYALLLAQPPLGLGLTEDEVKKIGKMSLRARFKIGSS